MQCRRQGFDPWVRKIPWRRKWQPTTVLLPGKFHGWQSLVGYSPEGRKELDTTELLHLSSWLGVAKQMKRGSSCQLENLKKKKRLAKELAVEVGKFVDYGDF